MRRAVTCVGVAVVLTMSIGLANGAHAASTVADDRSVHFGDDAAWLAIRGHSAEQIAAALKLTGLRPSTWGEGLAAANADGSRTVFLTPDVHGWTLVVGAAFFERVESQPPTFHTFTRALSEKLGTKVQFFASKDATEADAVCAWARASNGIMLRAFSCFRTRQRAVNEGVADTDALDVAVVNGELVGTTDVAGIAGSWSIDPSGTHPGLPTDRRIPEAVPRGFIAELPEEAPAKVVARSRPTMPDWIRDAAVKVKLPPATLDRACTEGDAAACRDLAVLLLSGPRPEPSFPRVAAAADQACDAGTTSACALSGWMMRLGLGVDEDRATAQGLFEIACDGGHAPACFLLGVSLQRGESGSPALSRAWDAYERSCAGGYRPACTHTRGVGARERAPAGLAPLRCTGARAPALGLDPGPLLALLERVRTHQPLEEDELGSVSRWQARLLRNAVFASRGRAFDSRDLRAFFPGFSWYVARSGRAEDRLNAVDRRNVSLFQDQEACAEPPDATPDEDGDWRLVEIYLAREEMRLPQPARRLIGVWEACMAVPDQGCPTLAFHPNGWVIARRFERARIGSWRMQGRTLRVRFFAEMREMGEGFSPADPWDENDDEPSRGVPKLFPLVAREQGVAEAPFGRDDEEYPVMTFAGVRLRKKSRDPREWR